MEFQALPWSDQRMYIEQLAIHLYYRDLRNWEALSEEEKWYYEEPSKPLCLIEEEIAIEQDQREIVAPDIMGG